MVVGNQTCCVVDTGCSVVVEGSETTGSTVETTEVLPTWLVLDDGSSIGLVTMLGSDVVALVGANVSVSVDGADVLTTVSDETTS